MAGPSRPRGPTGTNLNLKAPLLKRLPLRYDQDSPETYLFRPLTIVNLRWAPPQRVDDPSAQNLLLTLLGVTQAAPFVARGTDWVQTPIAPARRDHDAVQNLLSLLTVVAPTPFRNAPDLKPIFTPVRQSEAIQNLLTTLLPTTLKPFVNPQNLTRAVSHRKSTDATQDLHLTLLPTTLRPFVNDPNLARTLSVRYSSEATQNLLTTLFPTTLAPFVNPLDRTPTLAPVRAAGDDTQNLLSTLLAALAVATPFSATEWTQPVLRASRAVEPNQNLLLTILPTTLAPFKPIEWTVATGRVWRQYQAESNRIVLAVAPKPFTNDFLPTIPRATGRVAEAVQNLLATTLASQPVSTPLIPLEWGRPASRIVRSVEAVHNLLGTLLPTTLAPFSNDTDKVQAVWSGNRQSDATENLLTGTLGLAQQPMPFIPVEWTANRMPTTRVAESTTNRLNDLLPTTLKPLNLVNWPRALGAVSTDRAKEAVPNLTIRITPQPTPFIAFDWLQPRVSRFRPSSNVDPNFLILSIVEFYGGLSGTALLEAFARVSELEAFVLTGQLSAAARNGNLDAAALMGRLESLAVNVQLEAQKDKPEMLG